MNIQADILRKRNAQKAEQPDKNKLSIFYRLISPLVSEGQIDLGQQSGESNGNIEPIQAEHFAKPKIVRSNIARSFLQLTNLDSGAFERLGRYEMSLWRQTVQIVLLLNSINRDANDKYVDGDR